MAHAHKAQHVTSLLTRLPSLPFLLIGDDVQEDPEIYCSVALQHPGRIAAIWIRELRQDHARRRVIEALRMPLAMVGTDLVVATDTVHFTRDAVQRQWIATRRGMAVATSQ